MRSLYCDYRGDTYTNLRDSYEPGYSRQNTALSQGNDYMRLVEDFLSEFIRGRDATILDWGGDTGLNTPFHSIAKAVHIYDPSNKAVQITNAVNIYKSDGFLVNYDYDLAVLSNVLEHIPFPSETLNDVTRHISRQCVLYVEVPYETIQTEALTKPPFTLRNKKFHWHEHINLFSLSSLSILLQQNGLEILRITAANASCDLDGVSFSRILQVACKKSANE